MQKWEIVLQEQYEQDRMRLLDYREIDLEFKEWLIQLLYEEVTDKHERSEYDIDDSFVHDDWICDRECVRTEQDQIADSGSDKEDDGRTEISAAEERLARMIADEPEEIQVTDDTNEEDIYESFYEEIDEYKTKLKSKPKKKHYKRK